MKVAAFIDGRNTHYACRTVNYDIDFKLLLAFLRNEGTLVRAGYYTPYAADDDDVVSIRPLIDWLQYNGFHVVAKQGKTYVDATTGRIKMRSSTNVDLAIDALRLAPHVDQVFLFSGDSELVPLVTAIKDMGRIVTVVSALESHPIVVSDELRRKADRFLDLAGPEMRAAIGKRPRAVMAKAAAE